MDAEPQNARREHVAELRLEGAVRALTALTMIEQFVMEPINMPWGNRSMLVRDPDGNVLNVFSKPRPEVG